MWVYEYLLIFFQSSLLTSNCIYIYIYIYTHIFVFIYLFICKKVKVKCTLVQALRLCIGRTAHRESRGIALPFLDHGRGG